MNDATYMFGTRSNERLAKRIEGCR